MAAPFVRQVQVAGAADGGVGDKPATNGNFIHSHFQTMATAGDSCKHALLANPAARRPRFGQLPKDITNLQEGCMLKTWMGGIYRSVLVATMAFTGVATQAANPETIDKMVTGTFGGYTQNYTAGGSFMVFPSADYYVLNDGSSWDSGAGVQYSLYSTVEVVEREGNILQYTFKAPANGILYSGTDYSFGDHSAQGVLGVTGDLVLEAQRGSRQGVMKGYVTILSNDATWYDTFNYYSAAVGQSVYFETTYSLIDARFTQNLFNTNFTYNEAGFVDFTQVMTAAPAVPEPSAYLMVLAGLGVVALRVRRTMR